MAKTDKEPLPSNGKGKSVATSDSQKLDDFLTKKLVSVKGTKRVAIFSHATPDPDTIGSFVALRHLLLHSHDLEADCFYDGDISHPQNKTAVQLLNPDMKRVRNYKASDYLVNILVDTIPSHAGTGDHDIDFDIVIDHHKELPGEEFKGLCIHHHSGSCTGIIHSLMEEYSLEWQDDDESHIQVASAILVGIMTDTDFCTRPDTTYRDFQAQQHMFRYSDADIVRKVVRFNWPMSWIKLMGTAINEYHVQEGVAVAGLAALEANQKDAVASIADWMLTWGNIQTSVVFAFFDGEYISGSIRTVDPTIEVHELCAKLGGRFGEGGGKSFAGRYAKPLGAFEFDHEEDPEVVDRWWSLQKEREIGKIFKLLNK